MNQALSKYTWSLHKILDTAEFSISKMIETSVAISVSFKYFNLVVNPFNSSI